MIRAPVLVAMALLSACADDGGNARRTERGATRIAVLSHAGSLARPLKPALAEFTRRTGIEVRTHSSGSLEAARRITELDDVPDAIALADEEVFSALLVPGHVTDVYRFARNRMVVAFTPLSRHAADIDSTNWWRVLARNDVEVGRSDPALDPNGYRTLLVLRLAERAYRQPGLGRAILARSPLRNVRPKSADVVALLEAGALDYAFAYESVARGARLRYVNLPPSIDLGDPAHAAGYGRVSVRVPGRSIGDSITITGAPIRFAIAIPTRAPHPDAARELLRFLIMGDGIRLMRGQGLATLDSAELVSPLSR